MSASYEKYLWPVVGVVIFAILVAFYIEDRRRLAQGDTADQQTSAPQNKTTATKASGSSSGSSYASKDTNQSATSNNSASGQTVKATSMDIDEYHEELRKIRNHQLEANVVHHQGFSGSIDEYLKGVKSIPAKNMQANSDGQQSANSNTKTMSKGKEQTQSAKQNANGNAYHGSIDDYLAKYGDGKQTKLNKTPEKPFNQKEHMGFHGSYEDYAKKYN